MQNPRSRRPRVLAAGAGRRRHHRRPALGRPTRPPASASTWRRSRPRCWRPSMRGRRPDVPFGSLLLTAHAAVLAALSGERDVVTGYVPAGAERPLPCPLSAEPGTWRELLDRTRDAERELLAHAGFPVEELLRDRGCRAALRAVFGAGADLPDDAVLGWAPPSPTDGPLCVSLPPRRAGRARPPPASRATTWPRCTGWPPSPDAASDEHSLLSAEEIAFQLDGLAGPQRELPDRRFHELFEQRVRTHPDAVAAERAGRRWTYRELNARANRSRTRCSPAAWAARAWSRWPPSATSTGWRRSSRSSRPAGVYLPVEPHLPADRIATVLRRAECAFVLTEPGSTATLDQALRRAARRCSGSSSRTPTPRHHPDTDLGRPGRARPARLHLLHLRLHRRAQGRHVRARRDAQPPPGQDRRPGDRRGPDRGPDRPAELRHLALAADLGAAGRRPHPDRAAGRDPRRGPLRRHRSPTGGSTSPSSCPPTSRSC